MKQLETILEKLDRPGIMGRERYFHAVVLVPFVEIDSQQYIVLEKRAPKIRQGGEVSFPGGGYEKSDKNIFATAVRETSEELGIDPKYIHPFKQFDSIINPLGSLIDVVIGKIDPEAIKHFTPNSAEVDKIILVPWKWLQDNKPQEYKLQVEIHSSGEDDTGKKIIHFPAKELGIPARYHKSWKGHAHKVYAWQYDGETIWGVTAEILVELLKV